MAKQLSPVILGSVVAGKFSADDKDLLRRAFWPHEGKRVELTVKRHRKNRTLPQNNYYWGVVVPMVGDAIGESDLEAIHEVLKREHNYYIKPVGKQEIRVPMSTADLNTAEFEEYLEKIRRWASEWLSLYIPLPNEVATTETDG